MLGAAGSSWFHPPHRWAQPRPSTTPAAPRGKPFLARAKQRPRSKEREEKINKCEQQTLKSLLQKEVEDLRVRA